MPGAFSWDDGIDAAVSLTYDDGLPIHCSLVGPLLRQHAMHATFYPPIESDLRLHPDVWRRLAAEGNELGNHTVFHPCRQDPSHPYAWLDERYDLRRYSAAQMKTELELANLVLHLLDGETERSYGNTCCDTSIGSGATEQSLEPLLQEMFIAARGALTNRIAAPAHGIDLFNIGCIDVAGWTLDRLQSLVNEARAQRGWAVLMIHGIGRGTHDLYIDSGVHERFIVWLAGQPALWVASVREVARHIERQRAFPHPE
jgi:sialate O-acetylesterase